MKEDFLYFLWQSQYFDKNNLQSAHGESLQIVSLGQRNTNAGPDFSNCRVLVDGIEWAGNVEMHLKSSDWNRHEHSTDRAYDSVILHVVWEDDSAIARPDGTPIPTLALAPRTNEEYLTTYKTLLDSPTSIPCAPQFPSVEELPKIAMRDRVLIERLNRKANFVTDLVTRNWYDWEETAYQVLAYNFGFKVNAEPFLRLAQVLPLKTLQKHRDNMLQIEALLFGQAGFLDDVEGKDDYTETLRREYQFLMTKYDLRGKKLALHEWKFLRLRPANFPTLRLAQFAALIQHHSSLFSLFINVNNYEELSKAFQVLQSEYWQSHYQLGKTLVAKTPKLGRQSIENIMINTVVTLLVAYSHYKDDRTYLDKAIQLLESLPEEYNHIIDRWDKIGLTVHNAYDSQALLEWYNEYCSEVRCLECQVGLALVKGK